MEEQLVAAYTPSPGEILAHELAARGWSQRHFAAIIGRPPQAVNEILRAKKQITPGTALRIATALGTSPELWINLEADYRLALARQQIAPQILAEIIERSSRSSLLYSALNEKRSFVQQENSASHFNRSIVA